MFRYSDIPETADGKIDVSQWKLPDNNSSAEYDPYGGIIVTIDVSRMGYIAEETAGEDFNERKHSVGEAAIEHAIFSTTIVKQLQKKGWRIDTGPMGFTTTSWEDLPTPMSFRFKENVTNVCLRMVNKKSSFLPFD
jgi:hypothetical protein